MRHSYLYSSLLAAFFVSHSHAENTDNPTTAQQDLGTVYVTASPFSQQIGTQTISSKQIDRRPTGNGNLTELLKSNMNVRFSNDSGSSSQAGEIAPDEISFHGEKYYNNNFTIDNVSNNDNLHPAANNGNLVTNSPDGYSPNDLPAGGTQSFYIDNSIVKNLEVFDSNVSAKYGKFTGGVVNAELKTPSFNKASGKIYYRTTRDNWAKYHLQEGTEDSYNTADSFTKQPQFTKQQYGIVLNQPINPNAGLLFSYNRTESKIPYYQTYLKEWVTRHQRNDTFMLRGAYATDNGDLWKATLMYAPHTNTYFLKNIKNGEFTNTGGGFNADIQWNKQFDFGKMHTYLGFKRTGNEIDHGENAFYNYNYTKTNPLFDWVSNAAGTSSQIGGYGTTRTQKNTWTLKQDWDFNTLNTGSLKHDLKAGWEYNIAKAKFERDDDVTLWTAAVTTAKTCTDCEAGKYFYRVKQIYPANTTKAKDNTAAVYLEDQINWGKLNLNLGLRYDYSQYLKNHDFAPRISASYDVFGNQNTRIFGGWNRYYANTILGYALRNGIGYNETYTRKTATDTWGNPTLNMAGGNYITSDLKTPRSDEVNLGFAQRFKNHELLVKWVHRKSQNQFTRTSERLLDEKTNRTLVHYYLTNNGKGKNDTFSLSLKPLKDYQFEYVTMGWELGGAYNKTKTNSTFYDASATGESDSITHAIYENKLIGIDEVPPANFGGKWQTVFTWKNHIPKLRLNWDWDFRYNSAYTSRSSKTISCPSDNVACGSYNGKVIEYTTEKFKPGLMVDWRLSYSQPIKKHMLTLTADVNNVFNKRIASSGNSSETTYKMGRNFWLGASYSW